MTNYFIEGSMGAGKTLTATFLAYLYSNLHPSNKIFANYNLKGIKNFHYVEYGFIDINEFNDCLIILDDIVSVMSTLKGFSAMLVLSSRKTNVEIIFTSQYYTDLSRKIRMLSLTIKPYFDKETKVCSFIVSKIPLIESYEFERIDFNKFNEPIHFNANEIFKLYDTNEKTSLITDDDIYYEIIRISKTPKDIRNNVFLWKNSQNEIKKIYKRFEKDGIDYNSDKKEISDYAILTKKQT